MEPNRRTLRPLLVGGLIISGTLALFYLFVLPALVASHTVEPTLGNVLFAGFLYAQFWMLTTEYAYSSAAALYGFRRQELWPVFRHFGEVHRRHAVKKPVTGLRTATACVLSYVFTLYGFAVAYTFVSHRDPKSFMPGSLGLGDAFYFSVVTAATVGYGDIAPRSPMARALVVLEVFASLIYGVFFFSILASRVRQSNGEPAPEAAQQPDAAAEAGLRKEPRS